MRITKEPNNGVRMSRDLPVTHVTYLLPRDHERCALRNQALELCALSGFRINMVTLLHDIIHSSLGNTIAE